MIAMKTLSALVFLPALMSHAGGWAVITVEDLPDYVVAGKPVELSFMIRQHGQTPLPQLHPTIEASSGRLTASATAAADTKPGRYTASLILPSSGDWAITIRSSFGPSDITLLPLTAVEHGKPSRPVSDVERGQRLFVAKGCVTCHQQIEVGPKLDGKKFDVGYISGFLADPPAKPTRGNTPMPNLGLQQREIASLVAYLNSDRQVTTR